MTELVYRGFGHLPPPHKEPSLLCERFHSKAVEVQPVSFDVEIAELRQKLEERHTGGEKGK